MNYKKVCLICGRTTTGKEYKKILKVICNDCLRTIRNQSYLVEWVKQKEERSLRLER